MPNLTNPAARLHEQLYDGFHQTVGKSGLSTIDAWSRVWGLEDRSLPNRLLYTRRMGELVDLTLQVRVESEEAGPIARHQLFQFEQVERLVSEISMDPLGAAHVHLGEVDAAGWFALSTLGLLLGERTPDRVLDPQSVEHLINQTRGLIDLLRQADDLPVGERVDMISRLRQVEESLLHLDLAGGEPAAAATDGLIGCLVRLMANGAHLVKHPVAQGVLALAVMLGKTIGFGADVTALGLDQGHLTDLLGIEGPADD